ncbi:hypothetical protein BH09SUM1_BH09SUM1_08190 [soil metagenome]
MKIPKFVFPLLVLWGLLVVVAVGTLVFLKSANPHNVLYAHADRVLPKFARFPNAGRDMFMGSFSLPDGTEVTVNDFTGPLPPTKKGAESVSVDGHDLSFNFARTAASTLISCQIPVPSTEEFHLAFTASVNPSLEKSTISQLAPLIVELEKEMEKDQRAK